MRPRPTSRRGARRGGRAAAPPTREAGARGEVERRLARRQPDARVAGGEARSARPCADCPSEHASKRAEALGVGRAHRDAAHAAAAAAPTRPISAATISAVAPPASPRLASVRGHASSSSTHRCARSSASAKGGCRHVVQRRHAVVVGQVGVGARREQQLDRAGAPRARQSAARSCAESLRASGGWPRRAARSCPMLPLSTASCGGLPHAPRRRRRRRAARRIPRAGRAPSGSSAGKGHSSTLGSLSSASHAASAAARPDGSSPSSSGRSRRQR